MSFSKKNKRSLPIIRPNVVNMTHLKRNMIVNMHDLKDQLRKSNKCKKNWMLRRKIWSIDKNKLRNFVKKIESLKKWMILSERNLEALKKLKQPSKHSSLKEIKLISY